MSANRDINSSFQGVGVPYLIMPTNIQNLNGNRRKKTENRNERKKRHTRPSSGHAPSVLYHIRVSTMQRCTFPSDYHVSVKFINAFRTQKIHKEFRSKIVTAVLLLDSPNLVIL